MDAKVGDEYVYSDGKLTYTVTDQSGRPIARAEVTLNGETRLTDDQGMVQFNVGRGTHTLKISAAGYMDQTVTVTV